MDTNNYPIVPDGGISTKEMRHFQDEFAKFEERLKASSRNFHGDISVKDRGKPSQKTTFELWVQGVPKITAISQEEEIHSAFRDVIEKAMGQFSQYSDRQRSF